MAAAQIDCGLSFNLKKALEVQSLDAFNRVCEAFPGIFFSFFGLGVDHFVWLRRLISRTMGLRVPECCRAGAMNIGGLSTRAAHSASGGYRSVERRFGTAATGRPVQSSFGYWL